MRDSYFGVYAVILWAVFASISVSGARASEVTPIAIGATFQDCQDSCPEMIVIGPGSFNMGLTEDEETKSGLTKLEKALSLPRHPVTIQYKFAIGKFDITRAEFATFVQETGYQTVKDCPGYATTLKAVPASELASVTWATPGFIQTDRDPVVCVNWQDVSAYLEWISSKTGHHYRLPTEAEWEFVARAGSSASQYWGDQNTNACRYANVADLDFLKTRDIEPADGRYFNCVDGYPYTSPGGSFLPNSFGVYDMLGNVFQMTEDCLNYSYIGAPSDGSAWLNGDCVPRVTRGGSYRMVPKVVRFSFRFNLPSFIRSDDTGFRLARDL
jgi:sulfatase modifying factor 1